MEIGHPLALPLSDRAQNLTMPLSIKTNIHSPHRMSHNQAGSLTSSGSEISSPETHNIPRMNLNNILKHHAMSIDHTRSTPSSTPSPPLTTNISHLSHPITPLAVSINNNNKILADSRDHMKTDIPVFPGISFMTPNTGGALTPDTSPSVSDSDPLTPASTSSSLSPVSSSNSHTGSLTSNIANSLPSPNKEPSLPTLRGLPSMQDMMFNSALQGFVGQSAVTPLTTNTHGLGNTPNAGLVAAAAAAVMAARGQGQTPATLPAGLLSTTPPSGVLPATPNDLMSQAMNNVYSMWGEHYLFYYLHIH